MEISDLADWFYDIETAITHIQANGGIDVFDGDKDSTSIEIEIINWGGLDGYIQFLEKKCIEAENLENILKNLLFAYVYDIPTITCSHGDPEIERIKSIMPVCHKCCELFPCFLDNPAFVFCNSCSVYSN